MLSLCSPVASRRRTNEDMSRVNVKSPYLLFIVPFSTFVPYLLFITLFLESI